MWVGGLQAARLVKKLGEGVLEMEKTYQELAALANNKTDLSMEKVKASIDHGRTNVQNCIRLIAAGAGMLARAGEKKTAKKKQKKGDAAEGGGKP